MRLINTNTRRLESFGTWDTVPPYAILSHVWEKEEVLFEDLTDGRAENMQGWKKIEQACDEAEKLGIFYVWVDTCCICKQSSAELSQSINSMFAWYRDARVCLAYIGDVDGNADEEALDRAKYWTRSWTLQELIAPTEMMFFNKHWNFIGFRSSLATRIAEITGIASEILEGGNLEKLHDFSVAMKFSWTARREATYAEDRAYSLMGLFGVNMSLIYGEGEQGAFFRLQKEIFAVYADHSIFAWHYLSQGTSETKACDLLASSLSAFKYAANIINEPYDWGVMGRPKLDKPKTASSNKPMAKYSAISHGMRVEMLLEAEGENRYLAYLACRPRTSENSLLCLRVELDQKTGQYRRLSPGEAQTRKIDGYTGNHVTLQDVYVAAPRLDFASSARPVRYQIAKSSSKSSSSPKAFLCLVDDTVHEAGFTQVEYCSAEADWGQQRSNPEVRASPGLRLWHHEKDSSIMYRHEKTKESFTVVIGTSRKFSSEPQGFPAHVVDDMGTDTSADEVLEDFLQFHSLSFTDLSTQMFIKHLSSGKQVTLSANVTTKEDNENPTESSFQFFSLLVLVKEAGVQSTKKLLT